MVFGRKGLGGQNQGLEEQRGHLARTEAALVNLEQALARFPGYRSHFPNAWFDSPEVAEAAEKVHDAREVVEQLKGQLATASSPSPTIAQLLDSIDQLLAARLIVLDSFAAVLIGRQHIWNERGSTGQPFNPSVREAQQALHADACRLAIAIQQHIDELRPLRNEHRDYWPPNLNLEHLQAYLGEGRRALDLYSGEFAKHGQPLSPQASIELLILAQRMEKGVEMIQTERQNLAVTIVARNALKNSST